MLKQRTWTSSYQVLLPQVQATKNPPDISAETALENQVEPAEHSFHRAEYSPSSRCAIMQSAAELVTLSISRVLDKCSRGQPQHVLHCMQQKATFTACLWVFCQSFLHQHSRSCFITGWRTQPVQKLAAGWLECDMWEETPSSLNRSSLAQTGQNSRSSGKTGLPRSEHGKTRKENRAVWIVRKGETLRLHVASSGLGFGCSVGLASAFQSLHPMPAHAVLNFVPYVPSAPL